MESASLVKKTREKSGKTFVYSLTEIGERVTEEYAAIRAELLLSNLGMIANFDGMITKMTQLLSVMTRIYEETARSSATFSHLE